MRAHPVSTVIEDYADLAPLCSSAKDQLTNQNVAVKKIMKPFSTPVLAKRTYRELKLLKHLRHENVISLSDIFISPLEDMYASPLSLSHAPASRAVASILIPATATL